MDRIIERKHKYLSKKYLWLYIIGIVLLLVVLGIIFGDKSSKLNVDEDKLTIDTVTEDLFKDYIAVIGTVEPNKTIYLDATEGGSRVEKILIEEGNMVNKGDIIVKLSNTQLVLAISDFEANVSRISNEVRQSRLLMEQQTLNAKSQLLQNRYLLLQKQRAFDRNKILFAENHLSEEEFKLSEEEYELTKEQLALLEQNLKQDSIFRSIQIASLERSLKRMQDNLEIVQSRLESLNYRAPVDGELASLNLEEGQVIAVGQRIGQINILDSYKLRVDVDEYYISRVTRGLVGECDFSGKIFKAVTTKIYPEVRAGRFGVDMEFRDTVPEKIRIGQTSRIRLELGQSRTAVLIPRGGFFQSTGGQWVYVVDESGKYAYKRNIRLGSMNPMYYEVLEGLEPGEKVIVSNYDTFGDADKLMFK